MTSMASNILFIFCATIAFLGGLMTVVSKRPLRSAMGLLATIISLAGLFLTLSAQLLAAIQLIVYAGAVVVLFVFVIMLIGPDSGVMGPGRTVSARLLSTIFAVMITSTLAVAVGHMDNEVGGVPDGFGGVDALGDALYRVAGVPFELVSAALLVSIVGAMAIARSRTAAETEQLRKYRAEKAAQLETEQG